jgi:hypothetical protein
MAATYTLIALYTVGSGGTTDITFNSIPQTYTHLLIKHSLRNNLAATQDNINLTFNGATSNYRDTILAGNGTGATAVYSRTNRSEIHYFYASAANALAGLFSNGELLIPDYTSSKIKALSIESAVESNITGMSPSVDYALSENTGAITSLNLNSNNGTFVQHGTVYLYGISTT